MESLAYVQLDPPVTWDSSPIFEGLDELEQSCGGNSRWIREVDIMDVHHVADSKLSRMQTGNAEATSPSILVSIPSPLELHLRATWRVFLKWKQGKMWE